MRPVLLACALAAFLSSSIAAPPGSQRGAGVLANDAVQGETPADGGEGSDYTIFNGIKVPPMKEIQGAEFAETIKDGYWWVKHYSPYCGHCKAIAPLWQTLYEFYATSDPLQGMTKSGQPDLFSPNSFHGYYNFHFASINCIAFGDVCDKNGVRAWPTFLLYKDGEFVEKYAGGKSMEDFSNYVEEKLEQIKPGSRPREGVHVPKPGAKGVDRTAEPENPLSKDKDVAAGVAAGEKQNKAAALSTETTSGILASETAKSGKSLNAKTGPPPNPKGVSTPLTPESFQKLVTTSQDPWFVKFYVPWCPHCQHLAPTWAQLAKEMEGKLNIGEVNCEASPRLCKDAKVSAYPTIYFFRGGERVEYEGLRGLGDLLSFVNKALDSDVKYVDAAAFKEMEETEEVIFVYFFDHATTSEDFAALDRLTLSLIGHAKIVKTDSEILANRFKISTWPRLLVSRDGRPSYYNALAPKDMRDFRRVLTWMQSVWLPIVPELSASNAKEIMAGKYVVLGILSRDRPDEFLQSKRELKNAALEWMDKQTQAFHLERQELRDSKQLRIEEAEDRNDQRALRQAKSRVISITEETFRKQVAFAWVDGVFWERWLRSTYGVDVSKGERVIINDEDNRRYWDVTDSGAYIMPSRTSILETLPRIVANPPKLTPKSTIGAFENVFFQIRNFGTYHPYLSFGLLIISVVLLFWVLRNGSTIKRTLSRNSSGYFHLDGKEGLLGTTNGKAD
ncbi:protein disulfide-isomerase domain [Fonsecaea nubica]|uniref:Protein disulfide-isomerase domain n=1 Tax=Fonsecaea nubica TaxID=856822 RepID=A0A178CUJ4_9EURO|nr:protein disulfide-isomerase domain [Fonsecaea nubica]OAL32595.1 protein disulfide-isomerase domain [Fonsecaea nubica]